MYVFKSLNSQDIIISPLEINKSFETNLYNVNYKPNITGSITGSDFYENISCRTLNSEDNKYKSIKHLYYSNYIFGEDGQVSLANLIEYNLDGTTTGSAYSTLYDNYLNTTLNPFRSLPDGEDIGLISISKKLFGDNIKPKSFSLSGSNDLIYDNGEGILVALSGSEEYPVGNIIYEHGMVILYPVTSYPLDLNTSSSNGNAIYGIGRYGESIYGDNSPNDIDISPYVLTGNMIYELLNNVDTKIKFQSSYTIYESLYKCTIEENEFNVSQNKTLLENKDGKLKSFSTGSYFNPYITSVGLYNENYELLAVAKMSQPLPISRNNNMDIIIKMDMI